MAGSLGLRAPAPTLPGEALPLLPGDRAVAQGVAQARNKQSRGARGGGWAQGPAGELPRPPRADARPCQRQVLGLPAPGEGALGEGGKEKV